MDYVKFLFQLSIYRLYELFIERQLNLDPAILQDIQEISKDQLQGGQSEFLGRLPLLGGSQNLVRYASITLLIFCVLGAYIYIHAGNPEQILRNTICHNAAKSSGIILSAIAKTQKQLSLLQDRGRELSVINKAFVDACDPKLVTFKNGHNAIFMLGALVGFVPLGTILSVGVAIFSKRKDILRFINANILQKFDNQLKVETTQRESQTSPRSRTPRRRISGGFDGISGGLSVIRVSEGTKRWVKFGLQSVTFLVFLGILFVPKRVPFSGAARQGFADVTRFIFTHSDALLEEALSTYGLDKRMIYSLGREAYDSVVQNVVIHRGNIESLVSGIFEPFTKILDVKDTGWNSYQRFFQGVLAGKIAGEARGFFEGLKPEETKLVVFGTVAALTSYTLQFLLRFFKAFYSLFRLSDAILFFMKTFIFFLRLPFYGAREAANIEYYILECAFSLMGSLLAYLGTLRSMSRTEKSEDEIVRILAKGLDSNIPKADVVPVLDAPFDLQNWQKQVEEEAAMLAAKMIRNQ